MSLVLHLRKMARNNAWSNCKLHAACLKLPGVEFTATRTGYFQSIHATLNHILSVDHYYMDALTGGGRGPTSFTAFVPHATMTDLATAQAASDRRLIWFCDALTEQASAASIQTDRGKAGIFLERCDDLLAHLFQHQIHHRGQVHNMLSGTSVAPPQLDEYFLAFDVAERAKDIAALGIGGPESVTPPQATAVRTPNCLN